MRKKKELNKENQDHWIKNWPEDERPRELLLQKGPDHVSDAGLIAVLIRSGTKGKSAVALGRQLIKEFGGLRGLLSAKKSDLRKIRGLGPAKVAQIMAAIEITKRNLKEQIIGKNYVENDKDVIDYLSLSMRDRKEEFFKVIYLNKANAILAIDELARGTVDEAAIYPREVIKRAFDIGACAVIFVHNHPSGSLEPSQRDIDVTKKLISACKIVDITPLDHIIISPNGYVNLKSKGLID
ncbi:DNA repair protein RadC [candidate division WOR-3 bacterium]|nr:DNA repair protein RadC [candidate division WOR-3 bacterium]